MVFSTVDNADNYCKKQSRFDIINANVSIFWFFNLNYFLSGFWNNRKTFKMMQISVSLYTSFIHGYIILNKNNNFISSAVKSSRLYPFLILNVILFSVLFTYICTDGFQHFLHAFLKFTQNNLEYLTQNTNHLVI